MQTIDIKRGISTAADLADALDELIDGDRIYVIAPDGLPVTGFKVVDETLSDGSKVTNVILFSRRPDEPA